MEFIEFRLAEARPNRDLSSVLSNVVSYQIAPKFNGVGAVTLDYAANTEMANYIVNQLDLDRVVEIKVWIDDLRRNDLDFLIEDYNGSELEDAQVWKFSGRTNVAILDFAVLLPRAADNIPDQNTFRATNGSAGSIMLPMFLEAIGRGALGAVTGDGWNDSVDSRGEPWTTKVVLDIPVGQTLLDVLLNLAEMGMCEFVMRGYKLSLYNPGTLGVDRTGLDGPGIGITYRPGPEVPVRYFDPADTFRRIDAAITLTEMEAATDVFESVYGLSILYERAPGSISYAGGISDRWSGVDDDSDNVFSISPLVKTVIQEFSKYPPQFVLQTALEQVRFCGNDYNRYDADGRIQMGLGGTATDKVFRVTVNMDEVGMAGVLHHEFAHVWHQDVDAWAIWMERFDTRWRESNPLGFEYGKFTNEPNTEHPVGFMSSYAQTNVLEDVAETMRYMTHDAAYRNSVRWRSNDDILYNKTALLREFLGYLDLIVGQGPFWQNAVIGLPTQIAIPAPPRANAVVLRQGRDIVDSPRKKTTRGVATWLLGLGGEGVSVDRDLGNGNRVGRRREAVVSQQQIINKDSLGVLMDMVGKSASQGKMENSVGLGVAVDGSTPMPGVDFDNGDWILLDKNYITQGTVKERLRVIQYVINGDINSVYDASVTLNDYFAERDEQLSLRIDRMIKGQAVIGASKPSQEVPEDLTDNLAPMRPQSLILDSAAYINDVNQPKVLLRATWPAVTANEDGTRLNDLIGYDFAWIVERESNGSPGRTGWTSFTFTDDTFIDVSEVPQNAIVRGRVRSVDRSRHQSPWRESAPFKMVVDTVAPNKPSTPQVSNFYGVISAIWDGKDSNGAAMAQDFNTVEFHYSLVNNFTPSASTLFHTQPGAALSTAVLTKTEKNNTYFIRVVGIDFSGNRSEPSDPTSAKAEPVVVDDIGDIIVTATQLGLNAVTAGRIAANAINDPSLIVDEVITSAKIRRLAVGSAQIADLAVNNAKIARLAVGSANMMDLAVTTAKIGDASIINAKIADLAVNDAKIGSIGAGKITTGFLEAQVTITGSLRTNGVLSFTEMNNAGFYSWSNNTLWARISPSQGNYLRGDILATTFRSIGFATSGRGFVEIGNTGDNDPVDEVRMHYAGTKSSIRNPSNNPGALRISVNSGGDTGSVDFLSGGIVLANAYRILNRLYGNTYISFDVSRVVFSSHGNATRMYFEGVDAGNQNALLSNGAAAGGAIKMLSTDGIVQARVGNTSRYGAFSASAFNQNSNPDLKENIVRLNVDALELAKGIGLHVYNWKGSEGKSAGIGVRLDELPPLLTAETVGDDAYSLSSAIGLLFACVNQLSEELAELRR